MSTASRSGAELSFYAAHQVLQANLPAEEANWEKNDKRTKCACCEDKPFSMTNRRHHCRQCGKLVCNACSQQKVLLIGKEGVQRVCKRCYSVEENPSGAGGGAAAAATSTAAAPPAAPAGGGGGSTGGGGVRYRTERETQGEKAVRETLEKVKKQQDEHGQRHEAHTQAIDHVKANQLEHGQMLSKIMDEHGQRHAAHTTALGEHGKMLSKIMEMLKQQQQQQQQQRKQRGRLSPSPGTPSPTPMASSPRQTPVQISGTPKGEGIVRRASSFIEGSNDHFVLGELCREAKAAGEKGQPLDTVIDTVINPLAEMVERTGLPWDELESMTFGDDGIKFDGECVRMARIEVERKEQELKKLSEHNVLLVRQHTTMEQRLGAAAFEPAQYARMLDAPLVRGSSSDTHGRPRMLSELRPASGPGDAKRGSSSALVFDCGTGETKCLKLSCSLDAAAGQTYVSLVEVKKAPGVIDFIKCKPASAEDKKKFLSDVPEDTSPTLSVEEFVRFAEQQLVAHPDIGTCTIGTSAWARDPEHKDDIFELSKALRRLGIVPKRLPQEMEAVYESAAIAYAAHKKDVANLTGNIGSGGGSVQYMKNFKDSVNMEVGHRKGMDRLAKADDPLAELDAWAEDTVAVELATQEKHAEEKLTGTVMAISACYYAAMIKGVGLANADDKAETYPATEVVAKMEAKLVELKQLVAEDCTCLKDEGDDVQKKKRKSDRMNLCNLTLQTMLYKKFFDLEKCEICFKRDWVLPAAEEPKKDAKGKLIPNFRTTWSAGWYLHYLRKKGFAISTGSVDVLATLDAGEHDTVIIDCGTGETKVLKYSFQKRSAGEAAAAAGPGSVILNETKKAPGALDFLTSRYTHECKDNRSKSEYITYPKGTEVDEMLTSQDFVDFAEQAVDEAGARRAIIGTSSWHRRDKKGKANWLMDQLTRTGIVCKKLRNEEEALYESAAVAYAAAKLDLTGITGVIGSGGGSTQFVKDFKDTITMEVGYREGQDRLIKASKGGGDPIAELDKWASDTVSAQISVHAAGVDKLKGKVVAISACYYAASIKGVDLASDTDKATTHKATDVVEKMEAKLEELKQLVLDDPKCLASLEGDKGDEALQKKNKDRKGHAMNLCNLMIQTKMYKHFFKLDECEICFKRDWLLPTAEKPEVDKKGKPKPNFRTTWTAGFYLHHLKKQGIGWPASNAVLDQMEANTTGAEDAAGDGETQMLALGDIAKLMIEKAGNAAEEIVPELKKLVETAGGRLGCGDVIAEVVIAEVDLKQTLIAKMDALLQENANSPSFVPKLQDVADGIGDCLRCTVVFPAEKYYDGVRAVEEYWDKRCPEGQFNSFSNFWHEMMGQTTHMGIDAYVCSEPLGRPYTWKLEVHTEEGLKVRDGERELLKTLSCDWDDREKYMAYFGMKKRWDTEVPKPPNAHGIGDKSGDWVASEAKQSIWQLRQTSIVQKFEMPPQDMTDSDGDVMADGDGGSDGGDGSDSGGGDDEVATRERSGSRAKVPDLSTRFVRELKMGDPKDTAGDIWERMGIGEDRKLEIMTSCIGSEYGAIEQEFKEHGQDQDAPNKDGLGSDWERFQYVAKGYAAQLKQENGVRRDWHHHGLTLDQFCQMEEAKEAKLKKAHVLALRLYTSNSYWRINGPLRDGCSDQNPHKFAATTFYIYDGLKKLRVLGQKVSKETRTTQQKYFRGLADVTTGEELSQEGAEGCELACLSTSCSEEEAKHWAMKGGENQLLLELTADHWMNWGIDMQWLSMYAGEKEALFPPLTSLSFKGTTEQKHAKGTLTVRQATLNWPG